MSIIRFKKVVKSGTRYKIVAYDKNNNRDCYYTKYTDNLRIGTLVCIYYSKPISKIVCYGRVKNSSIDEYVEIDILHIEDLMIDTFEKSKTNSQKVLDDMYLLPNVYYDEFSEIKRKIEGEETNAKG